MAAKKSAPINTARLFRTVMQMAETVPYDEASLAKIAKAAKLSPAQLRRQYLDFTHLLIAVQQFFLDGLRDEVISATAQYPPGLERVRCATLAFLNYSLKWGGLRRWLIRARHDEPLLAEGFRRQTHSFGLVISTEFHALGWPYPLAASRMYLAAIQEAARLEQAKGEPLTYVREAIWDIARFYTGQVKAGVAK